MVRGHICKRVGMSKSFYIGHFTWGWTGRTCVAHSFPSRKAPRTSLRSHDLLPRCSFNQARTIAVRSEVAWYTAPRFWNRFDQAK